MLSEYGRVDFFVRVLEIIDAMACGANATNTTDDGGEAQDFDLWYVGVLMQIVATFFGALGNVFIKQSFNVHEAAEADSSLDAAGRRRARLV